MSDPELKDTQPNAAMGETRPNSVKGEAQPRPSEEASQKAAIKAFNHRLKDPAISSIDDPAAPLKSKKGWSRWLAALVVITLIAIGLLGGYSSGMRQRYDAQDTQVSGQLDEQFQLGQQAFEAGNYELAKQYFEGILRTDSNYAGITAAYTDLLLRMQATPTPVFSPTPLVSPTPDLRGVQEIFNMALQLLNTRDWNGAITNLDSLRKSNSAFRTAEVDGMYYMALHQRGVEKIANACQNVNLNGGIYDLTLAEYFVGTGNLDADAESLRRFARLYIIAASFWDQDWLQAQFFFAQVMTGYPHMSDSSCKSATSRWVEATIKVADLLFAAGDFCGAELMYETAFTVYDPYIVTVYPTATEISIQCDGGGGGGGGGETPVPVGTPTGTPTLTPMPTLTP